MDGNQNKEHFFGKITNNEMVLSAIGEIVEYDSNHYDISLNKKGEKLGEKVRVVK